jgi:multidrug efflux pump subunit AcrB
MQNIKKEVCKLLCQVVIILIMQELKDQQQSFKELLLILMASCLLVFCVLLFLFRNLKVAFILLFISVLVFLKLFIIVFTNTPLNVEATPV